MACPNLFHAIGVIPKNFEEDFSFSVSSIAYDGCAAVLYVAKKWICNLR